MVPLSNKLNKSKISVLGAYCDMPLNYPLSSSQASESVNIDTEQMFRLIDSILPFEACLYYQFLPLALEGKYLKLGMVVPQDSSALDYARNILAYLKCSLKTEQIPSDLHQSMLSAYLNYTHTSSAKRQQAPKKNFQVARSEQPTLILDDSQLDEGDLRHPDAHHTANLELASDLPPIEQSPSASTQENGSTSLVPQPQKPGLSSEVLPKIDVQQSSVLSTNEHTLPMLEIQGLYLSRPIEFIAALAPKQLLQELLARVLISGIGRLYFERQAEQGRILWSQDGVLQSVLEGLSLPVFQGVIIELKRIVNLPLLPTIDPKQVEIERRYQQEDLLLRLRVMPGTHGEEATLQVLRGAALKFYQRQKIEKLGLDALKLAQQLQQKLNEIHSRSGRYPIPLEALPALNQLLRSVDQQLEDIAQLQINQNEPS
jgi:type II secretory ATPase GspE/PulE/Tfp pilus assembly ATPase PilB-like protein